MEVSTRIFYRFSSCTASENETDDACRCCSLPVMIVALLLRSLELLYRNMHIPRIVCKRCTYRAPPPKSTVGLFFWSGSQQFVLFGDAKYSSDSMTTAWGDRDGGSRTYLLFLSLRCGSKRMAESPFYFLPCTILTAHRLGRALLEKLAYLLAYIGFLSLWKSLCPTEHSQHAQ